MAPSGLRAKASALRESASTARRPLAGGGGGGGGGSGDGVAPVATGPDGAAAPREYKSFMESVSPTLKDPSHAAFYAGFLKGMACGVTGLTLLATSPPLRSHLWASHAPLLRKQAAFYALAAVLIVLFLRDGHEHPLRTVLRWSRLLTTAIVYVADKRMKVDQSSFFAALRLRNPALAATVEASPDTAAADGESRVRRRRLLRMAALRVAGFVATKLLPGAVKPAASAAIQYATLRPVLGDGFSLSLAALSLLPASLRDYTAADDVLEAAGEALRDALDAGKDAVRPYYRRLPGPSRRYFYARYGGYLSGCGFLYSLLMQVPGVAVVANVAANVAAAVQVEDILSRNADKAEAVPLLGEEVVVAQARGGGKRRGVPL